VFTKHPVQPTYSFEKRAPKRKGGCLDTLDTPGSVTGEPVMCCCQSNKRFHISDLRSLTSLNFDFNTNTSAGLQSTQSIIPGWRMTESARNAVNFEQFHAESYYRLPVVFNIQTENLLKAYIVRYRVTASIKMWLSFEKYIHHFILMFSWSDENEVLTTQSLYYLRRLFVTSVHVGDPITSSEWVKLETSDLISRLIVMSTAIRALA